MNNLSRLLSVAVLPLAAIAFTASVGGCDPAQSSGVIDPDGERAQNAFRAHGSCAASDCGGQSSSGSCWCDDLCENYGDCCTDKVPVCDAPEPGQEGGTCGGFAGVPCEATLSCVMPVGVCELADGTGVCQNLGDVCTTEWTPVCGCDGQTYANACTADAAGVTIDSAGACEIVQGDECGDRIVGACVAGTVCQRYPGTCGTRDLWGTCEPEVTGPLCTLEYAPVCGCDGVTYSNACNLGNGALDYDGICNGDPGGFCGGVAGVACVAGYACALDGDYPDAGGTCVEAATDSCSGQCGGSSVDGSCWCDAACAGFGDCCSDITTACG